MTPMNVRIAISPPGGPTRSPRREMLAQVKMGPPVRARFDVRLDEVDDRKVAHRVEVAYAKHSLTR
jgi:hypothetical protein